MNVNLPWNIGDNDIQSKSIKAWSDRQQTSAELASSTAVRRAASERLFGAYLAQQINETLEYNALYDAITAYELDLLA
tara:strand:- start:695 stop:928 length:234 start_codon:yes stop_codon:yes gene_type:complete